MTEQSRTLRFGRRTPKRAPALKFADIWTGRVPDHPLDQNNLAALGGGWQMLGNDRYGDCVAVTAANYRRVMTHLRGLEYYPDLQHVIDFYKSQNKGFPTQDDGMDIQTALEELLLNGDTYFDGIKPVAFAKVDHSNIEQVEAAIAIFGAVWTGVYVTDANMAQFDRGADWDVVAGAKIEGGHSIITGGYDAEDKLVFVTWAQTTEFTKEFWLSNVEEAWIVIWPENLRTEQFEQGVDTARLVQAYHDLTGKVLPVPPTPAPQPAPEPPQPAPAPSPGPEPTPAEAADEKLASAAFEWLQHGHSGINHQFARKLQNWLLARGYDD
jgi:hypothetical protein